MRGEPIERVPRQELISEPRIDHNVLIGHQLREMANRLCDGSLAPLLTHLVGSGELSEIERESLRNLVEKLDSENQSSVA